jgi:hypothetical protein
LSDFSSRFVHRKFFLFLNKRGFIVLSQVPRQFTLFFKNSYEFKAQFYLCIAENNEPPKTPATPNMWNGCIRMLCSAWNTIIKLKVPEIIVVQQSSLNSARRKNFKKKTLLKPSLLPYVTVRIRPYHTSCEVLPFRIRLYATPLRMVVRPCSQIHRGFFSIWLVTLTFLFDLVSHTDVELKKMHYLWSESVRTPRLRLSGESESADASVLRLTICASLISFFAPQRLVKAHTSGRFAMSMFGLA